MGCRRVLSVWSGARLGQTRRAGAKAPAALHALLPVLARAHALAISPPPHPPLARKKLRRLSVTASSPVASTMLAAAGWPLASGTKAAISAFSAEGAMAKEATPLMGTFLTTGGGGVGWGGGVQMVGSVRLLSVFWLAAGEWAQACTAAAAAAARCRSAQQAWSPLRKRCPRAHP